MKKRTYFRFILLVCFLSVQTFVLSAAGNPEEGKTLFRNYCAQCHSKDMKKDMTGPALGGIEARWEEYGEADLYAWIRNSQAMIASGHPKAKQLWDEWGTIMTSFPNLKDEEIASILAYIKGVDEGTFGPKKKDDINDGDNVAKESSNGLGDWVYYVLFGFLGILALILARVISNLNVIAAKKENPNADIKRKSLIQILTSKGVIGFAIFALILIAGYKTVNNAVSLGRQQGYAPEQPIKFSHETHAGINGIDCQYCHDGARRSKHSVIPAMNTCINCHKAIDYGSKYGTAEISKIYVAAGFNPETSTYFENYDAIPDDSLATVFKAWMMKNTALNDDKYEAGSGELKDLIDEQWSDLEKALTSDVKTSIKGAVEWVKIHNLPDHVYFNHAQHVTVGKIDCQKCHGKVQEMEVLEQKAPLSMGWCVNCHRETEVQFSDNAYYDAYKDYHSELSDGTRSKVTVNDIGGLECQKCHY